MRNLKAEEKSQKQAPLLRLDIACQGRPEIFPSDVFAQTISRQILSARAAAVGQFIQPVFARSF